MFDIIARFINFYLITQVVKPLHDIWFRTANFHIAYRNVHESLNTALARFLMPVVFTAAVLLGHVISLVGAVVSAIMLPVFFVTHCVPVLLFEERANVLPWLSYSTCLDGQYANDVEFIRDFFSTLQIEMVGFKIHPIVELLIIRMRGEEDQYTYMLFGSVSDLNEFLMRIQERIDKTKEVV